MAEAYDWRARTILDSQGEKIGKIDQVYLNPETDQPDWALVKTGMGGDRSVFVPVASARPSGEDVQVQVTRDQVENAPVVEGDRELLPNGELELLRHYGMEPGGSGESDGSMTRSEEELQLRTARRPYTRVRLRKYIVTEMVTTTVPVRREEVRLEREPINDPEAVSEPADESADEVYETVLHEEQVVVETRVVATERVRLRKETITEHRTVSDEVRKEQIETSVEEDG